MMTHPPEGAVPEDRKLAERVADTMLADIAARKFQPGDLIGSIADLTNRFSVSSSTLREAIRILERHGVVRAKPGPGGGVIMQSPGSSSAAKVISVYAEALAIPLEEVHRALALLEMGAARRAAERADSNAFRQVLTQLHWTDVEPPPLEWLLGTIARRVFALGQLSGNPVLAMVLEAVLLLRAELMPEPEGDEAWVTIIERTRAFGQDMFHALCSGDADGASAMIWHWHNRRVPELFASIPTVPHRPADLSGPQLLSRELMMGDVFLKRRINLGEAMAHLIVREIRERRLRPGERLGSEAEWVDHFGVARPAFREAIRMLERDEIVQMRRGNGGGLFVGRPDPEPMLAAVRRLLAQEGIPPGHFTEIRALILPEIAVAAARSRPADAFAPPLDAAGFLELAQAAPVQLLPLLYRIVDPRDEIRHCDPNAWQALCAAVGRGDPVVARQAAAALTR